MATRKILGKPKLELLIQVETEIYSLMIQAISSLSQMVLQQVVSL
jgi:hypothetical protein